MHKIIGGLILVLALGFAGCFDNTAVVATADLLGQNGEVLLIDTDDMQASPTTVKGVNAPHEVLTSPDGRTAYVAGGSDDRIGVIDVQIKTSTYFQIKQYPLQTRRIWDMAITKDGARLIVGTQDTLGLSSHIEIYDAQTLVLQNDFSLKNGFDFYLGRRLAVDPSRETLYVVATALAGIFAQVRAYAFDGTLLDRKDIDPDILDIDNYDIAISPQSDLLLAVSTQIFPFKVTGSSLEALNPIAGKGESDNYKFYGKTKILFTKNYNMIYVNSAGFHVPGIANIGGSSVCLDKQKVLANDPDPFVFSLVDFSNDDLIKWIVKMLSENIENIIDPVQLYGIADSTVDGDTCYMVIASVRSFVFDLAGLQDGKYILAIYKTLPLIGNVWVGGKVIDTFPNGIAVNPVNNTLTLTYFWQKEAGIYHRNPIFGWLLTKEDKIAVGDYPRTSAVSSISTASRVK
jgi:DNA-binding beta-propeller fold protein YncE